jgi:hypothetical protein
MKKEKSLTWYVNHARKIASDLAKYRDNYTCLRCSRSSEQGWKIDASHIKPKGTYRSMSADVDNIKALCSNCHRWWHSNPTESGIWFEKTFPKWAKKLNDRAKKNIKFGIFEWRKKYEELKEEFFNIIN